MSESPETIIQYDRTLPYIEDRDSKKKPSSYLVKDGENSYKVVKGRRPSTMLLVNNLRKAVDDWRDNDYPGVTETTKELLTFWFYNDHKVNGELFNFWFCQREAIETLIYLFEVKKFADLKPVIQEYSENFQKDLFRDDIENVDGTRKLIRYFPELKQEGEQDLPEKNLLRYAFKMATGSGKTYVMAMIIVWSYFNNLKEKDTRFSNNFLIVAPNIIVYERLAGDFGDSNIFYKIPLIPDSWKNYFNLKVTMREDDSPLNPSGNLIVNNIQQLYETKQDEQSPKSIIDEILGKKPQKDLSKSPVALVDKIKKLENLLVINDEAHHVHDEELEWNKTLMKIHKTIPNGLSMWLDFSATPKTQTGMYYPWIIVDYPLAQAVEDRIVKSPLIVHRVDSQDPEDKDVNTDNVVQKYGDWITAALERWKEHYKIYSQIGKKPVLFIMVEKNNYADKIAEVIRKRNDLELEDPEEEVVVIHVESTTNQKTATEIRISEKDLNRLRELVREIDEPDNKVKIIVSNMMLREGWDVQNVVVVLGLRPFTSKAQILPEQAIGRGLRLMKNISPDKTQTLEVMGTQAFEDFVKELEKEGVGINVQKDLPPLPITIAPEKSRLKYDIEIPKTELRYNLNTKNTSNIDPLKIPSIYSSDKLEQKKKISLQMEFTITETTVHKIEIEPTVLPSGREIISHITNEIIKRAHLTTNYFSILYPIVEKYILLKCFEVQITDVEDEKLRKQLFDISVQEAIIDLLAREVGNNLVEEKREIILKEESLILSEIKPFTWRRKHTRCDKTVFNFVATYNDFEEVFAKFLDRCSDIEKFAALAGYFSIDYLSSRGAIRFYQPDFVAVQKTDGSSVNWIIETKGREFEDTDRKDEAITKFCKTVSDQSHQLWRYQKIMQTDFDNYIRRKVGESVSFNELLEFISNKNTNSN